VLLPFPSDRRPAKPPVVTWALLGFIVLLSLFQILVTHNGAYPLAAPGLAYRLGLIPSRVRIYNLFSYSFLHTDASHLLINVFYLWVFGSGVEAAISRGRFLALYLVGGAIGGALQILVAIRAPGLLNPNQPILGASAACAALVGLYAVRYYRDRITFVGLPYKASVVEVVTLFLCAETGVGLWELFVGQSADGVAHWAHIGGFVFGLCAAYSLKLDKIGQAAYRDEDVASALSLSNPGAAIAGLEAILARDPGNANARADMARAWATFGDVESASRHYADAIHVLVARNERKQAAYLYEEMRACECDYEGNMPNHLAEGAETAASTTSYSSALAPGLETSDLYLVGLALSDVDSMERAAEAFRAVSVRSPDAPEAETALVKVATIYIHRLSRQEEARILLHLFLQRYPNSALRNRAEELQKQIANSGQT